MAGGKRMGDLAQRLLDVMDEVAVLPRRMRLSEGQAALTVPLLRGVWGAALKALDERAYEAVFRDDDGHRGYVIRPGPGDERAIEFVLYGRALEHDSSLMRAWDVAAGMGYGAERERVFVTQARRLEPDGGLGADALRTCTGWKLSEAGWPGVAGAATTPVVLRFDAPLRLMREGHLIKEPALADIVVGALRRLGRFAGEGGELRSLQHECLELARQTRCGPWRGQRLHLRRWSGSQRTELELRGVAGELELPEGPGPLWPLLLAASWLHVGKATIVGLGQCLITRMR